MANIHRLILAVLLLLVSNAAFAVDQYRTHSPWLDSWYSAWGSKASSCSELGAVAGAQQGGYPGQTSGIVTQTGQCDLRSPSGSLGQVGFEVRPAPPGACVLGMEPGADGKCVCKAGTKERNNACVPIDSPADATEFCKGMGDVKAPFKLFGTSTGSAPTNSCYMPDPPFEGADATKGCTATLGDSVAVPNADGTRSWSATGIATGAVCTDAPPVANGTSTQNPPPRSAENPCPSGFPGTVNGATVCVPSVPDSGIGGVKTTSTTTAAGVKTEITEVTECNGGICRSTPTTRTYNAAGTLTNTVVGATTTQPIGTKCATDPSNKVCSAVGLGNAGGSGTGNGGGGGGGEEGPSSFGGDCAAGFKAQSDDAVINAMAEETFRQNCKVNPDADSQTLGKAEAAKTGNLIGENPNNSSKTIGPADFDTSDAIGGGASCIADRAIQVAGANITVPFSMVCEYLAALGYVLLACSFLLAGRIVTRG